MFQGFRDLLTRVEKRIDDIKTQPITVADASRFLKPDDVGSLFTTNAPDPALYLQNVDSQAGSSLIVKLEASMRKLHDNNDSLVLLAEGVDGKIYPAAMSVVHETKTIEDFKKQLITLPTIISSINHTRKQLDTLGARFAELEAALDAHAIAHNEEQTSKQKEVFGLMVNTHSRDKQQQLAALKNEIEITKYNLEKKRAEDKKEDERRQVAAIEAEYEQARQRLRQDGIETKNPAEVAWLREEHDKAIQDALEKHRRNELELHQKLSNAPLIPSAQRQKKPAAAVPVAAMPALEAVKLDVGRAELDEFLSDVKEDAREPVPSPDEEPTSP